MGVPFSRRPCLLGLCNRAVDNNHAASTMLYILVSRYRFNSGIHERNGQKWVAQPVDAWLSETCLSIDQYKRGVKILEELGLIVRERRKFRKPHKFQTAFIRPTAKCRSMLQLDEQYCSLSTVGAGQSRPPGRGSKAQYCDEKGDVTEQNRAMRRRDNKDKENNKTKDSQARGPREVSLRYSEEKDVPHGGADQGTPPENQSSGDPEEVWRDAHREANPDVPMVLWSGKEIGQAKTIWNGLAQAGLDPATVLRKTIVEWRGFANHLETRAGWSRNIPAHPRLGLICAQLQEIVNWHASILAEERDTREQDRLFMARQKERDAENKARDEERNKAAEEKERSDAAAREEKRRRDEEIGLDLSCLSGPEIFEVMAKADISIDGFEKLEVAKKREVLAEYARKNGAIVVKSEEL